MKFEIRSIKLAAITTTAGTQIRASLSTEVVGQYADAMQDLANNKFPPVVVFQTGDNFILADGFHRVAAAKVNGFTDIQADIRHGGKSDALWYALTANRAHGLQLTAPDKKRSIILALENFPTKSQQEIANHVGCSQKYVSQIKSDVIPGITPSIRTDSKGRVQPTRKPHKASPPPLSSASATSEKPAALRGIDVSKLDIEQQVEATASGVEPDNELCRQWQKLPDAKLVEFVAWLQADKSRWERFIKFIGEAA